MALNNLGLGFVFTARDLASGTIQQVGANFGAMDRNAMRASQSYQRNFHVMGAGLAIVGAGAATLAGAFALAHEAAAFQQEVARVGAVSNASAEDLMRLHDAALAAGSSTQFDPTQSAQGLGVLAQQGFNATQSISLLTPTLDLAAGGMISVEQAAEGMTAATHVFNLSLQGSALAADQMLAISNSTALSAGELAHTIGTVARGAQLTGQSIEEMLPSMGLLRNQGLDASVAASGVSSALTFMSARAEKIHQTLGIDLVETLADGTQRFRPFMDIAMEAGQALETHFANPAERTAAATELFSRFGVGAIEGVFHSLQRGVTDAEGHLYQGAAAVNFLREQMRNAGGTAERFRQQLLATFAGQMTLLGSAATTLKTVIGEVFADAFRPAIEGLITGVRAVVHFIQGIPVGIRAALGQAIIIIGAITTALGTFVAAGAAIAIIAPFLEGIAVAAGGLLLAMLPLVAAFGAFAAAGVVVYSMAQRNVSVANSLARAWTYVRLTFEGLTQAFTDGAFSGAVRDELRLAENQGIRRFVLEIAGIGFRIQQFFRGFMEEWGKAAIRIEPAFMRMVNAFSRLGEALGIVGESGTAAIAGIPSEEFAMKGAVMADAIANTVAQIAEGMEKAANFVADFVEGFHENMDTVEPSLRFVADAFDHLFNAVSTDTSKSSEETRSMGRDIGKVFAGIVAGAAYVVGAIVWMAAVVRQIVDGIEHAFGWISDLVARERTPEARAEREQMMPADPLTAAWRVAGAGANAITGGSSGQQEPARPQAEQAHFGLVAGPNGLELGVIGGGPNKTERKPGGPSPAEAEAMGRAGDSNQNARAAAAMVDALRIAEQQRREQPVQVNLQVDGETILRATQNAERGQQAAGFQPVGAEG